MTDSPAPQNSAGSAYASVADMPPALVNGLKIMISRVRRIQWLRGSVATLSVLLFAFLAMMAVDITATPETAVRWMLWFTIVGITAVTAWATLFKPLTKPLSITRMARVLETRHPDLQERISSVIQLKAEQGANAKSGALLDVLIREALLDMDAVSPRQEFTFRSAKPFFVAFAVSAGIFALLAVVRPNEVWNTFVRVANPVSVRGTTIGRLAQVQPGDTTVLRGTPLTITVTIPNAVKSSFYDPTVRTFVKNRRVDERMRPVVSTNETNKAVYELTFPAVYEPFQYEIRRIGTSGVSDKYTINVIPPPEIEQLTVTYVYPEYTGMPSTQLVWNALMDVTALSGTHMTMTAQINTPAKGFLNLGDMRLSPHLRIDNHILQWQAFLTTNAAPAYSFELYDSRFGHTNAFVQGRVKILLDQPPVIDQLSPGAYRFIVNPTMAVPFKYKITDDFGIISAKLIIRDNLLIPIKEIPFELDEGFPASARVSMTLGLAGLEIGKTYSVYCEATDNYPEEMGGPNVTESFPVTLLVADPAKATDSVSKQLMDKQAKYLREKIETAASFINAAADQVHAAHNGLDKDEIPPESRRNVEAAQLNAKDSQEYLKQAAEYARTSMFKGFDADIDAVRAGTVRPAAFNTGRLLLFEPNERHEVALENITELRDAAKEVLKLLDTLEAYMKKIADLLEEIDRLKDMLALKQQLKKEKLTEEEKDKWMSAMQDLLNKPPKEMTLEEMLEALKKMLDADPLKNTMDAADKEAALQIATAAQLVIDAALDIISAAQIAQTLSGDSIRFEKPRDALTQTQDAATALRDALKNAINPPGDDINPAANIKAVTDAATSLAKTAEDTVETAAEKRDFKNPRFADAVQKTQTTATNAKDAADAAQSLTASADPETLEKTLQMVERSLTQADITARALTAENTRMTRVLDEVTTKAQRSTAKAEEFARRYPAVTFIMGEPNRLLQKAAKELNSAHTMTKEAKTEPSFNSAIAMAKQAEESARDALKVAKEVQEEAMLSMKADEEQEKFEDDFQQILDEMMEQMDQMDAPPMDTPPSDEMKEQDAKEGEEGEEKDKKDQPHKPGRLIDKPINIEGWDKAKGRIKLDALDEDLQKLSPEYRELVRQYFNELSKDPGK